MAVRGREQSSARKAKREKGTTKGPLRRRSNTPAAAYRNRVSPGDVVVTHHVRDSLAARSTSPPA
ncbi:hypothetical protein SLI_0605 [Streptomyces lividans 1326]|uniref:Uncharacterized protein n=1 Tax=Streptomyces lividans 1326 TaxID=1200984 RepID=A0A7U9H8T1_STRLI|nr:hypothetical protein SLI_0605 [Streptomyces lividans 1326]